MLADLEVNSKHITLKAIKAKVKGLKQRKKNKAKKARKRSERSISQMRFDTLADLNLNEYREIEQGKVDTASPWKLLYHLAAGIISWHFNHSFGWSLFHGWLGPYYLAFAALKFLGSRV